MIIILKLVCPSSLLANKGRQSYCPSALIKEEQGRAKVVSVGFL